MKIKFSYYRYILRVVSLLFIPFIFTSCKKYLDKKSNDSLIVPSTLSDLQALLDAPTTMNQSRTPSYGEASGDEFFIAPVYFNALDEGSRKQYTWQYYYFQGQSSDWMYDYQPVYYANLVLDLIGNIPKNNSNFQEWDNVKGSALIFRSYYFLNLLWNYAKAYDSTTADNDLGITLRLTSDFNVPSLRASNELCYEQIVQDTKAAIPLLPDYPEHVFRPSRGAAFGLLARCYLSMRDYKNALLYADSCLHLNNQLMDLNDDTDIPSGITASYPFKQFNKETVFYTEMNTIYSLVYKTSIRARIDSTLYDSYDIADLRRIAFFQKNSDGYQQFKGSYAHTSTCFSGIASDEMYLTRAECYIRANQMQQGLSDLNTVLNKRYTAGTFQPITAASQSDALNIVLQEREKELVMRGMRWMDLKRLNKEGANITLKRVEGDSTYTLLPNANFYALPIPQDIIDMTGMPQNDL